MFETLEMAPPDAILGLNDAFKKDANPNKINLSVGVFQDANGRTPILRSVKTAERKLLEAETNKSYLGIDGSPEFGEHLRRLIFGFDHPIHQENRVVNLQTPGGTGALRVAADLIHGRFPASAMWCSKPTWANHPAIFAAAGMPVKHYEYLDHHGTGFNFDAMLESLSRIPAGDAICLHACCHNPTGIDPTLDQWKQIAGVIQQRGILAVVDFAYQGFGTGLAEDAAGLLQMAEANRELLICSSFSKNFGLYGERVGSLTITADSAEAAQAALSHAKVCVRTNYSSPPKHGAAIVSTILADDPLRREWESEVADMRNRINGMRELFVRTMKDKSPRHDFSFIARQRGMFSYSGLTPLQVDQLRSIHAIYVVGSGRINVAGMTEANMQRICDAIVSVL